MNSKLFRFKAGYDRFAVDVLDNAKELIEDVEFFYDEEEVKKVKQWMETAKENEQYVSDGGALLISILG